MFAGEESLSGKGGAVIAGPQFMLVPLLLAVTSVAVGDGVRVDAVAIEPDADDIVVGSVVLTPLSVAVGDVEVLFELTEVGGAGAMTG